MKIHKNIRGDTLIQLEIIGFDLKHSWRIVQILVQKCGMLRNLSPFQNESNKKT